MNAIVTITDAKVSFTSSSGVVRRTRRSVEAVAGVSLLVQEGESVGIIGESGCGKTTLARSIVGLQPLTGGSITYAPAAAGPDGRRSVARGRVQMVFQDPYASLDPHQRVFDIIGESATRTAGDKQAIDRRVDELLGLVGLGTQFRARRASQLSGGQRQRVGIARALASDPALIVCDEPVTALDVSVQAQIVNLLIELRSRLRLTYIFIGHDVAVVEQMSDRIAVMYLGKLVEIGKSSDVLRNPLHPYTKALLAAVPTVGAAETGLTQTLLEGDPPSPANPPPGCRFSTRCRLRIQLGSPKRCVSEEPVLRSTGDLEPEPDDHQVACHFEEEMSYR